MFIEITQDGAGIVRSDGSESGLVTMGVQNCCVYIFQGRHAVAIIHDTGQLLVSGIKEVADNCGELEEVAYAINPLLFGPADVKRHRERRNRIKGLLKWKREVRKIEAPSGVVAINKEGRILVGHDAPNEAKGDVVCLPNKSTRHLINIVNNLFIPKNSQRVPPDIQYRDGGYSQFPQQLVATSEMEHRAEQELKRGDEDYQMVLNVAKQAGLI